MEEQNKGAAIVYLLAVLAIVVIVAGLIAGVVR